MICRNGLQSDPSRRETRMDPNDAGRVGGRRRLELPHFLNGDTLMKIDRIHHVAYRCRDAKETVLWYQKMLKMDFVLAIAEDQVPSTKEPDPYMHVFLDAGGGNVLAFFELPTKAPMGRDPNTPEWVQHIAFMVKDRETLLAYR